MHPRGSAGYVAVVFACVACGARSQLDLGPSASGAVTTLPAPQEDAGSGGGIPSDDASTPPGGGPDSSFDTGPACANLCATGSSRCEAGGISTCEVGASGCATWGAAVACASPLTCVDEEGTHASCVAIAPARPIAPLSTATVTSHAPIFRWALASGTDGAQVDVCRDRACAKIAMSFPAHGSSGAPPTPLERGVYFWRLHGAVGGVAGSETSVVWEVIVGARSASVNTSWGTMLDVNGDGFADLAVGVPNLDSLAGEMQIFLGGADGLSSTPVTYAGPETTDPLPEFGYSVRSAGDVNGDGFADLVVGAPSAGGGSPGAAYLYMGGPGGLSSTPTTIPGQEGKLYFGYSVDSAGDVNGDGYADVVIAGVAAGIYSGAAYLYLGSATGLSATPTSVPIVGNDPMVASAGDVNGDGYGDVLVGGFDALNDTGALSLYLGGASGLGESPAQIASPDGQYGFFGYSVACAGDVNGDGFADVVVGAPGESPSAFVYEGSALGLATTPTAIVGPAGLGVLLGIPASAFGTAVASAGDVNGDGFADVVVGAPIASYDSGAAFVYLGSASGVTTTPLTFDAPKAGFFGDSVSGAGDVNGDGFGDLVIGAPDVNREVGAAFVYLGSASGPSIAPITFTGPESLGEFGLSVE
jgi:hypothetical protein